MTGIDMDGIHYNVRCKFDTLDRSFRLVEGVNAGDMLSGRHERDLTGTYYDYSLYVEPEPKDRAAYDSFYQAISAPINSHMGRAPLRLMLWCLTERTDIKGRWPESGDGPGFK